MEKKSSFWGGREIPFNKTEEQAWSELQVRISQLPAQTKEFSISPWKWMGAAAAIAVLIVSVLYVFSDKPAMAYETGNKEIREITLPDGSIATLNADSKLTVDGDWSDERVLQLEGEAFFSVGKGSRFKVFTKYGEVLVLGTSFDVKARENGLHVMCETGRVLVTANSEDVILTPGQQAFVKAGHLVSTPSAHSAKAWMDGLFVFEDQPLDEVLNEIERQFNVDINHPDLKGKLYTGQFGNLNLDEALTLVCAPFGLDYTIDSNLNVTIKETKE
jgi:transmembrane sensor